jgi:hypothetical protein
LKLNVFSEGIRCFPSFQFYLYSQFRVAFVDLDGLVCLFIWVYTMKMDILGTDNVKVEVPCYTLCK